MENELNEEAKNPPEVRAAATLDNISRRLDNISYTLDNTSDTLDSISRTLDSISRTLNSLPRTLDNIIWRPIWWLGVTLSVLYLIRACTR